MGCPPHGQSHLCSLRLVLGWRHEARSGWHPTGDNGEVRDFLQRIRDNPDRASVKPTGYRRFELEGPPV